MSESSSLTDLPVDILVLIFPYLDARSFLSLCSTCKSFHHDHIRLDPAYWSHAARSTFRVPNRPVVQSDGHRWYRMYKRLLTQSRVYTWGSNGNGCLGHTYQESPPLFGQGAHNFPAGAGLMVNRNGPRAARDPQGYLVKAKVHWPTEMENTKDIGTVSDLQCGGWSTTILSSRGIVYTVGVLDGERAWVANPILSPLQYPADFPKPGELDDPAITIRQVSAGRKHVLGLTDSGRIWSWHHERKPASHIKFLHHEAWEGPSSIVRRRVRKVVAGWNKSSALISYTGIVLWDPIDGVHANNPEVYTMLLAETAAVPGTLYVRPRKNEREIYATMGVGKTIGEVINYILLESYVIYVTDLHRVFCAKIVSERGSFSVPKCLELDILHRVSESDDTPCATDIHGSFRSFAILKSTGEVLTATQAYLDACWSHVYDATLPGSLRDLPYVTFESKAAASAAVDVPERLRDLHRYPALQNSGVIALAFGDYHLHALHSNGSITSYGREPKACGTLGLGSATADPQGPGEGGMRGIQYLGAMRDGELVPQAYSTGRQVWFQREKATWLRYLASGGCDPEEAQERMHMWRQREEVQGLVSDWVEREGRDWDKRAAVSAADDDGLGAHFALSVAAAGWHSGALVLVNEQLAEAVARSCVVEEPEYGKDAGEEPLGPEPQVEEPPVSAPEDGEAGQHRNGTLSLLFDVALNLGRSFLGLPVAGQPSAEGHAAGEEQPPKGPPIDPLASPGKGSRYAWAYDSFPRLRLQDGSEMPGTIELS